MKEEYKNLTKEEKSALMFWVRALMKGLKIPQYAMDRLISLEIIKDSTK